MKTSGAPEVGDIVVAKLDDERGMTCPGTVIECRGVACLVLWGSESLPIGWWKRSRLRVITEGERND